MKSHLNKILWGVIVIIAVFFIVSKATAQEINTLAYSNQTMIKSGITTPLTKSHKPAIPNILRNTSWFAKSEFKFIYLPRHQFSYKTFKQTTSKLKFGKFPDVRDYCARKILPSNRTTLSNPKKLS